MRYKLSMAEFEIMAKLLSTKYSTEGFYDTRNVRENAVRYNTICVHISRLKKKGLLESGSGSSYRFYRPSQAGWQALKEFCDNIALPLCQATDWSKIDESYARNE